MLQAAAARALALTLAILPGLAAAQAPPSQSPSQSPAWLDPALLAAAKKEGSVVVYTSTNEREGLPLFKIFEDATGIKVHYVRAGDGMLVSRSLIEARAGQSSFDVIFSHAAHKLPQQMLAQYVPDEAKHLGASARDPNRRWHGVYANYNAPAYNTKMISASALPKSYAEFAQKKEWAGKAAIDGTDADWLKGFFLHFGEAKATQIIRGMVGTLNPVVTDGHLALARSVGAGEYWLSINNYVMLSSNVQLAGAPIEIFPLDPVVLFYSGVAVNAKAKSPNAARLAANFMLSRDGQAHLAKFGRLPTRGDVASNPPGILDRLHARAVVPTLFQAEDERKWQQTFNALFKPR
ncbi:MAG: ABC transporter substrate-binding protein [Xanthobacteraceae bacterium]|nr:ABC transporter substrate-binding protein [Xanthobacteraceae bacterium]